MYNRKNISDDLATHESKKYSNRYVSSIQYIVIHHTASEGTIESTANYHVNKNGWPGIGYHYVIDKEGQVNRVNSLGVSAYNTRGMNHKVIGIALIGDYEINEPKQEQLLALDGLIDDIQFHFGPLKVSYHKEHKATLCPGKHLIEYIEKKY